MSRVSLVKTGSDFYTSFAEVIDGVAGQLVVPGDCVLIKPNLVMPASPESGEITNPKVIEAVARYCLDCGAARVIIGEGPSYYIAESQLRRCFISTGVSEVAKRLGVEWVLFDDHSYRIFRQVSPYTPDEFRVTEFAFNCDKFINLPVLKTHYLTTVTLAMKNLKGCLKREDKPLFHNRDLARAIVDLCKIIKPTVNIIDCTAKTTVRQLGYGYTAEKIRSRVGLLIAGSDIVAVDAVGCAVMGIEPDRVPTVVLGAQEGLGENDLSRIDIQGGEIRQLKTKLEVPRQHIQKVFPLLDIKGAEKACSGCLIPVVSALLLLEKQGARLSRPTAICMGKNPKLPQDRALLLVGDCALLKDVDVCAQISGCPPTKEDVLNALLRHMSW